MNTLELTTALIQKPSITPNDAGCMPLLIEQLNRLHFQSEIFESNQVKNLWSRYGNTEPLFVFLGHTDVVPPGPLDAWTTPPFEPTIHENYLYGRGAVDMKGSIAAMVIAVENLLKEHPTFNGSIAFLLTSDEEGPAIDGTRKMVETLVARQEIPTWCLVGEPSSSKQVGDTIRNGRRDHYQQILKLKAFKDMLPIHTLQKTQFI